MEDTSIRATALDMAIKVLGNGQSPNAANLVKYADKLYAFLCEEVTEDALDAAFRSGYEVAESECVTPEDHEEALRECFHDGVAFAKATRGLAPVYNINDVRHNQNESVNRAWGYEHREPGC